MFEVEGYDVVDGKLVYYDKDGNKHVLEDGDRLIIGEDITRFEAEWEKREFTITYDLNGGEYDDGQNTFDELYNVKGKYDNENLFDLLGENDLTRDGYFFDGWVLVDEDGNVVRPYGPDDPGLYLTDDMTLRAVWTKKFTVTIYLDSSMNDSVTKEATRRKENNAWVQYYTLTGNEAQELTDYAAFTFTKFSPYTTIADDSEDIRLVADSIDLQGDIKLYALYFHLTFDVNPAVDMTVLDTIGGKWVTYGVTVSDLPRAASYEVSGVYNFNGFKANGYVQQFVETITFDDSLVAKEAGHVGDVFTLIPQFTYTDVMVRVYAGNGTGGNYRDIVVTDVSEKIAADYNLIISEDYNNLPMLGTDNEVEYIIDGDNAYFYEIVDDVRTFTIPLRAPDVTMDRAQDSKGNYHYTYSLHCIVSYKVEFQVDPTHRRYEYASIAHANIVVPVVDVSSAVQTIVIPSINSFDVDLGAINQNFIAWTNIGAQPNEYIDDYNLPANKEDRIAAGFYLAGDEFVVSSMDCRFTAVSNGAEYLLKIKNNNGVIKSNSYQINNSVNLMDLYNLGGDWTTEIIDTSI